MAFVAVTAGCDVIDDIIDDIRDTKPDPKACASSAECGAGNFCTVDTGVCNPPPGCDPGEVCPAVCYGTCQPRATGEPCGSNICGAGEVCCNASCGICTPPGGACTKQLCDPPSAQCRSDADCRAFAFMCTGCDCLALGPNDREPVCGGPGVQCFADPCLNKKAVCDAGRCRIASAPACGSGFVSRPVCLQCGIAGGCAREATCARTCRQSSDCAAEQTGCIDGLCQVQGCI